MRSLNPQSLSLCPPPSLATKPNLRPKGLPAQKSGLWSTCEQHYLTTADVASLPREPYFKTAAPETILNAFFQISRGFTKKHREGVQRAVFRINYAAQSFTGGLGAQLHHQTLVFTEQSHQSCKLLFLKNDQIRLNSQLYQLFCYFRGQKYSHENKIFPTGYSSVIQYLPSMCEGCLSLPTVLAVR